VKTFVSRSSTKFQTRISVQKVSEHHTMDIWMSLFISLLLFVVACLLNVVRIAILKRNAYIQVGVKCWISY